MIRFLEEWHGFFVAELLDALLHVEFFLFFFFLVRLLWLLGCWPHLVDAVICIWDFALAPFL